MEQEYFKEFQTKNGNTLFLFWRWIQLKIIKKKNAGPADSTLYIEEAKLTPDLEMSWWKLPKNTIFHPVVFMNHSQVTAEPCLAVLNVLPQPNV